MKIVTEQVYTRIQDVPPAPTVATIGAFDGVHRGHQYLLGETRARASALGARLLVVTFEPLPMQVFRPERFPGRIITNVRRRELLFANGADLIVELPFSPELAKVTAGAFVDQMIAIGPLMELFVGQDFALGHNREGTPQKLAELTVGHGTQVHVLARIDLGGVEVSSSAIRAMILNGRADDASRLLGHRFEVRGEVVRGAQIGRTIGFPTANVAPPEDLVPLQDGIYASLARVGEGAELLPAMTYIGTRPAVNTGARMIETHLFDFDQDLYGQQLTTLFVQHIRQDSDFPSVNALRDQLDRDEIVARGVLARIPSSV